MTEATGHPCLCHLAVQYASIPGVALALDRLRDEVTVAQAMATSTREAEGRLKRWKLGQATRSNPAQRILNALSFGPLPLALLDEDVHGPPVQDKRQTRLRRTRTYVAIKRLCDKGVVVKVGYGVYALPGNTEGLTVASANSVARLLADPNIQPEAGLTRREIADRLDVSVQTVHRWIHELRERGVQLVRKRAPEGKMHGPGVARYKIDRGAAA